MFKRFIEPIKDIVGRKKDKDIVFINFKEESLRSKIGWQAKTASARDSSTISDLAKNASAADEDMRQIMESIQNVYNLARNISINPTNGGTNNIKDLPSPNFTDLADSNFDKSLPLAHKIITDQAKSDLTSNEKFNPQLKQINGILGKDPAAGNTLYRIMQMGIRDAHFFKQFF